MTQRKNSEMVAGLFSFDDGLTYYFGFTRGEHWNGWACPYFEASVAFAIAKACGFQCYFTAEGACFYRPDPNDPSEMECYEPITIEGVKYWPIGTGSWTWEMFNR